MASPTMINSNQRGDAAPRQNGTAEPLSRDVVNAELKMAGKRGPETVPLRANSSTKSNVVLVRRIKRKNVSPMEQFTGWLVNNQTGLAFNLIALLFLAHSFFPSLRAHTTKFFTLSYFNPQTGRYGVGSDDTYFIVFFVVLLTGVRTFTIDYILSPFARRWNLSKKKELARFGEQGWLLIYCAVFWSMGVYLYYSSPAWLNLRNLWAHWPNREMDTLMKWYQLIQLAFWLQQIFVVNIEPRRKDHWQMFSHHILTITLVYCSIRYHHTPVGNLILILMDIGDLTLAIAKCSKYLGYSNFCDYMFGVFMASWFVCRQVIFPMVIYSVWKHTGEVMPIACFRGSHSEMSGPMDPPTDNNWYLLDPLVDSEGLVCFNSTVKWSFLSVLLVLNLIILVWFTMIVRVAVRVISGTGADDVRSDDEGESEEEDEFIYEEAQPLEEEVGVEDIDLKGWERRSGVKRQASSATGVSLPGHSDRKELLGRIGCEKQVD